MSETAPVAILGPTATGKSDLAIALAREIGGEIISLDSAMVYRYMDIGTAKPSEVERAEVPHHLIDICDPDQLYSAADFRHDCIELVGKISARGRRPIICGGTMMYYKALTEGMSPVPKTNAKTREFVQKEIKEHGIREVHSRLEIVDPLLYGRLHPNDTQRVSRALEVYYMTGRPMSYYLALPRDPCPFAIREFYLLPREDRSDVHPIIKERFRAMLDRGLLAEVEQVVQRFSLTLAHASLRCVGYRQAYEHLCGQYDYEEMVNRAVIATAHLAKHQMTWLRGSLANTSRNGVQLEIGNEGNLETVMKNC